jgi:glycerol uptake facilitator-like aquaporin
LANIQIALEYKIQISDINATHPLVTQISSEFSPKLDLSIEGMRSQQFSEWIFAFLLLSIIIFSGIVIAFMFSKNRPKEMKTGERMMFTAIIIGIVVAVIFGALQLLSGYLF